MFGYDGACWQQNVSKFLSSFDVIPRGSSIKQLAHVTDILTYISEEQTNVILTQRCMHKPQAFHVTNRNTERFVGRTPHEFGNSMNDDVDFLPVKDEEALRLVYLRPAYRLAAKPTITSYSSSRKAGKTEAILNYYLSLDDEAALLS